MVKRFRVFNTSVKRGLLTFFKKRVKVGYSLAREYWYRCGANEEEEMTDEDRLWIALKVANFLLVVDGQKLLMTTKKKHDLEIVLDHYQKLNKKRQYVTKDFGVKFCVAITTEKFWSGKKSKVIPFGNSCFESAIKKARYKIVRGFYCH